MSKEGKRIIAVSILCFIVSVCIVSLAVFITRKNKSAAISPLFRSDLVFDSARLAHFFEPQGGTARNSEPPWLTHIPTYKINSDRLREDREYPLAKNPAVTRIVALGDSFTYGLFVEGKESWPKVLEKMLNAKCGPAEVINLGHPGYDIRYSAERYILRGEKYDPDIILFFVKSDDFDLIEEYVANLVDSYRKEHGLMGNLSLDEQQTLWRDIREQFSVLHNKDEILGYQEHSFDLLFERIENPVVVLSLRQAFASNYGLDIKGSIDRVVENHENARFHMIERALSGDNLLPDDHPSAQGHVVIAEEIYSYLTESDLVTCRI